VIRVLFVEDDVRYRNSVETLLGHAPGFELAAAFGLAEPALAWAAKHGWDLAVFDLQLPDANGVDAIRRLKQLVPDRPVVALTVFEDPSTIVQAICAGADGYVLKRSTAPELLRLFQAAVTDGSPLTASVARKVLDAFRKNVPADPTPSPGPTRLDLTEREQQVLRGLVDGLAYKEVADRLDVSIDSVRTHVRGIYRKLQVHSVGAAVSRALRDGLV